MGEWPGHQPGLDTTLVMRTNDHGQGQGSTWEAGVGVAEWGGLGKEAKALQTS